MSFWNGKKRRDSDQQPRKKRMPLSVWLFYLGMITMSLTGVTFSRYSSVVHGTISVEVAASYQATFLDADGQTEVASVRVYEGQNIKSEDVPDLNACEAMLFSGNLEMDVGEHIYSDEDTVYRTFMGWSLDGVHLVDPSGIEMDQDLEFIAVYEILPDPPADATPSDATPSDATATPSDATSSDAAPSDIAPSGVSWFALGR